MSVGTDFIPSAYLSLLRPYVFKTVMLEQVCEELVRLGGYGIGKVVMKTGEALR